MSPILWAVIGCGIVAVAYGLVTGRAVMASPTLLLLDEPSLGLAPKIVEQIRDLIVDINKAGTGVLLIEQNAQVYADVFGADTVLAAHLVDLMDTTRVEEDALGERRLARVDVSRDTDVADAVEGDASGQGSSL